MKGRDARSIQMYKETLKQLTEIYKQQEIFWRQRSKELWFREGDHNIKYFHAATKMRTKVNHIHNLQDKEGTTLGWGIGLQETMVEYFTELFTTSNTDWRDVIDCVTRGITDDQNNMLLRSVDEQKVKNAIFSMHPDKSPGTDGMSPGFYQKYWSIVGDEVYQLTRQFFSRGKFERSVTETNIVLIPKKLNLLNMTELRPISLYNVIYKSVSKVLANRIKKVLNGVISETQSAFVPGRMIMDNTI